VRQCAGEVELLLEGPARQGGRLTYSLTNRRPMSSAMGALPASTTRASASGIRTSELTTRIAATASWSQVAKRPTVRVLLAAFIEWQQSVEDPVPPNATAYFSSNSCSTGIRQCSICAVQEILPSCYTG